MKCTKPITCVLISLAMLGSIALCADVPCIYDGSEFRKMETSETPGGVSGDITLAGPAQDDRGSSSFFVPILSEPTEEIRSTVYLVKGAVDPEKEIVHNKAVEIAARSPGPYNVGQVCFIDEYLRENWRYVSDTRGIEIFSTGSNTIRLGERLGTEEEIVAGAGDCDDYAILMASLLESVGGTTRIILAYGSTRGHAYTEVYVGPVDDDSTKEIMDWLRNKYKCDNIQGHLTEDDNSFWLNLDWNGTHPGGPLYSSKSQSIALIRDEYTKTVVKLPPEYRPRIATGQLCGKVIDGNGNPLSCTLMVTDTDIDKKNPYSVSGSGAFEYELPPGNYEVAAEKPGYSFAKRAITILENRDVSVDIEGAQQGPLNIRFNTEAVDLVKQCVYYTRNAEGRQVFKIRVYATGSDLYKIKSIQYSLHETFEDPEHVSTDASNGFEMVLWAWGRFPMPITVTTKDGNEYRYMYSFTFRSQLEDAERRGYRFIDATGAWDVIGGY